MSLPPTDFDSGRARQQVEGVVMVANYMVGLTLTFGGLAVAVYWRIRLGDISPLRAYYLYTAWAFGTLQLVAGASMRGRWAARWVLEMLPLAVPVVAYQYFILRFVFRQL